jgi:hypothetical protein
MPAGVVDVVKVSLYSLKQKNYFKRAALVALFLLIYFLCKEYKLHYDQRKT